MMADSEESNVVMILGLEPGITENRIRSFAPGSTNVEVFPGNPFWRAKVTFNSIISATMFVKNQRKKPIPGTNGNKLSVKYCEQQQPRTNPPGAISVSRRTTSSSSSISLNGAAPSNTVYINGLPQGTSEGVIRSMAGVSLSSNHQPAIEIYQGNPYWRAKVILHSVVAAEKFISHHHKKPIPGTNGNKLSVNFWEQKTSNERTVSSSLSNMSLDAPRLSKIVHVKGFPAGSTAAGIKASLPSDITKDIAVFNYKSGGTQPKITVFQPKGEYCAAKIVFVTKEAAQEFVNSHDNHRLNGHKLSVDFWRDLSHGAEEMENKQSDKPRTKVMNIVYVKGIPLNVTKKNIKTALQYENWDMRKIILHFRSDGTPNGSILLTFGNQRSARAFMERWEGKKYPRSDHSMNMQFFESTKSRRHPNAPPSNRRIDKQIYYAYDCILCFDIWVEEDMLGCVPIGRESTDMDTHFICPDCTLGHARAQLTEMNKTHGTGLPCGAVGCERVTLWEPVKRLLPEEIWRPLDRTMTESAVQGIRGLERCKNCTNGYIFEQDVSRMQYFNCGECRARFCRSCKIDYKKHAGKSCEQVDPRTLSEKEKRRLQYEERRVAIISKKCPGCGHPGIKTEGCNFMTCNYMNCKTQWCYLCCQKIVGQHFSNGRCEQFAKDDDRIAQQLQRLREEVRNDPLTREFADSF